MPKPKAKAAQPLSNVVVAVRVRPQTARERSAGAQCIVSMHENSCVVVDPTGFSAAKAIENEGLDEVDASVWARQFAFDHCYWSVQPEDSHYAPQDRVYEDLGVGVLENAWSGYNTSLFAYGQTGAGKSYSMMGTGAALDHRVDTNTYGLIPRVCCGMFEGIRQSVERQAANEPGFPATEYAVEVSYMEIYNEKVRDLFDAASRRNLRRPAGPQRAARRNGSTDGLKVRHSPATGAYVQGLTTVSVSSYEEVGQLIALGSRARTVASTRMNEMSSRSHAIFTVIFRQRELTAGDGSGSGGRAAAAPAASGKAARHNEKVSKISMVDLAGSERIHLSQVQKSDARLREAKNINRSLATLCDVIKALADAAQAAEAQPPGAAASAKAPFVPYRNSVLTWLLKESLGGNAKTTMLACVSPCDVHYEESISTLKYAERAKRVRNRAVVNEDSQDTLIKSLRAEVRQLKAELAGRTSATERVVVRTVVDPDMEQAMQYLQDELLEKERFINELAMSWQEREDHGRILTDEATATNAELYEPPAPPQQQSSAVVATQQQQQQQQRRPAPGAGGELAVAAAAGAGAVAGAAGGGGEFLPRLVNLNQDPLFSECLSFTLAEGITLIGSDDAADVQLTGEGVLARHCFVTSAAGVQVLCPVEGDAQTYVNGYRVGAPGAAAGAGGAAAGAHRLEHGARIVLGRHHVFRFHAGGVGHPDVSEWCDWECAQRELFERSPDADALRDGLMLQSLADKVRQLEAEREEYVRQLAEERSSRGSAAAAPAARRGRRDTQREAPVSAQGAAAVAEAERQWRASAPRAGGGGGAGAGRRRERRLVAPPAPPPPPPVPVPVPAGPPDVLRTLEPAPYQQQQQQQQQRTTAPQRLRQQSSKLARQKQRAAVAAASGLPAASAAAADPRRFDENLVPGDDAHHHDDHDDALLGGDVDAEHQQLLDAMRTELAALPPDQRAEVMAYFASLGDDAAAVAAGVDVAALTEVAAAGGGGGGAAAARAPTGKEAEYWRGLEGANDAGYRDYLKSAASSSSASLSPGAADDPSFSNHAAAAGYEGGGGADAPGGADAAEDLQADILRMRERVEAAQARLKRGARAGAR